MLVPVKLLADLGAKFGENHTFDIEIPSEVFHALAANFTDFRRYLIQSEDNGISYHAIAAEDGIVVAPVVSGESGLGKILAGVAILAIGAFMPFSIGLLGSGVITSSTIGASLILSGAGELFAPGSNNGQSLSTKTIGGVDTVSQGDTIPLCYGRVFIQGKAISAGTTTTFI
jgi:predicted phage tail protein